MQKSADEAAKADFMRDIASIRRQTDEARIQLEERRRKADEKEASLAEVRAQLDELQARKREKMREAREQREARLVPLRGENERLYNKLMAAEKDQYDTHT